MTVTTYQIAGRSPFPIITDFLAYAIERQTMKDPKPVHLTPSADVRALGWQAETRDSDGHLTSMHAPFKTDADLIELAQTAMADGDTLTIWPLRAAGEVRHG